MKMENAMATHAIQEHDGSDGPYSLFRLQMTHGTHWSTSSYSGDSEFEIFCLSPEELDSIAEATARLADELRAARSSYEAQPQRPIEEIIT
jgi:hypothetical protein